MFSSWLEANGYFSHFQKWNQSLVLLFVFKIFKQIDTKLNLKELSLYFKCGPDIYSSVYIICIYVRYSFLNKVIFIYLVSLIGFPSLSIKFRNKWLPHVEISFHRFSHTKKLGNSFKLQYAYRFWSWTPNVTIQLFYL